MVAGLWPGGRADEARIKQLEAQTLCSACLGREVGWDEIRSRSEA